MATFLRVLAFVARGWLVFAIMIFGSRLRGNAFGDPPIPRLAFLLAKLGVAVSFLLFLSRAALAPPQLPEHEPFLFRIWELRHNMTAYDAVYIAIAEALSSPLVTRDAALAAAAGHNACIELL